MGLLREGSARLANDDSMDGTFNMIYEHFEYIQRSNVMKLQNVISNNFYFVLLLHRMADDLIAD